MYVSESFIKHIYHKQAVASVPLADKQDLLEAAVEPYVSIHSTRELARNGYTPRPS